jgi:hypothetical protein
MIKSPKFMLVSEDLKSIFRGAVVAVGGALAVYLIDNMSTIIGSFQIPDYYLPIITAFSGVIVNILRKYLTETKYK